MISISCTAKETGPIHHKILYNQYHTITYTISCHFLSTTNTEDNVVQYLEYLPVRDRLNRLGNVSEIS